jgi:RHS repeat-associated protein
MRSFGEGQGETGEAVWFLSDHLGSTSVTVDEGGGVLAARRYDPWGSPRDPEDLLTDYTYIPHSGHRPLQREEADFGLHYYVARWYDSSIGHFIQADTIVPGAGNPAAWNRYGYVMYNPVKYVDPSGHSPACDGGSDQPSWCPTNSFHFAPITTFEFDPVLMRGGPGAVPITYAIQLEEDYDGVGLIGESYVSPNGEIYQLEDKDVSTADEAYWRMTYEVHSWTDVPGLANQALVWLRDNTDILKHTSGGYHLTGEGVVFDSTIYGYDGYPVAITTLSLQNHTASTVIVNNLIISRNGTNVYQDFGSLSYCSVNSVINPSSTWDYSVPIFGPGEHEVFIHLSSLDQYGMTSGYFIIP